MVGRRVEFPSGHPGRASPWILREVDLGPYPYYSNSESG